MTDLPGAAPSHSPRLRAGNFILDAWGDPWAVAETRQTEHGWPIFLGRPREMTGPMGPEVIITPELAAYFEGLRRLPGAMRLPISFTTIKRIRRILGHHRYQDAEMWWLDRLVDLHELTTADFCARHRMSVGAVTEARQAYLGEHRLRDKNWWKEPKMRDLLMSKMPSAWIAQKVGLAASSVRRIRSDLAREN